MRPVAECRPHLIYRHATRVGNSTTTLQAIQQPARTDSHYEWPLDGPSVVFGRPVTGFGRDSVAGDRRWGGLSLREPVRPWVHGFPDTRIGIPMPSWTAITLVVISIVVSLSVLASLAVSERLNRLSVQLQRDPCIATPGSRSPATCCHPIGRSGRSPRSGRPGGRGSTATDGVIRVRSHGDGPPADLPSHEWRSS